MKIEESPSMKYDFTIVLKDSPELTEELADKFPLRLYWVLLGWARGRTNRNDMRTTLERVKAEVE